MNEGRILVGYSESKREFLFKRGLRAVTCPAENVAKLLGVSPENIQVGRVRSVADVIFEHPTRMRARIKYCPEMFDVDRTAPCCDNCRQPMGRLETPGGWCWMCVTCKPEGPAIPEAPESPEDTDYGEHADGWKGDGEDGG